jgi:hypothetical protein
MDIGSRSGVELAAWLEVERLRSDDSTEAGEFSTEAVAGAIGSVSLEVEPSNASEDRERLISVDIVSSDASEEGGLLISVKVGPSSGSEDKRPLISADISSPDASEDERPLISVKVGPSIASEDKGRLISVDISSSDASADERRLISVEVGPSSAMGSSRRLISSDDTVWTGCMVSFRSETSLIWRRVGVCVREVVRLEYDVNQTGPRLYALLAPRPLSLFDL